MPGLLEVLAQAAPRTRRGPLFGLVFVLAVAVACVLADAKGFREIDDQAADPPQELLATLGGQSHPLRRVAAPSEKRIQAARPARRRSSPSGVGLRTWSPGSRSGRRSLRSPTC